jgi:Zn-dependent M16 (insulinase) family peptidase
VGKDFKKLNNYGDRLRYKDITPGQFAGFHHKYFLPLNNTVMVTGIYSGKRTWQQNSKQHLRAIGPRSLILSPINRVIDFKPFIYSVQMVTGGTEGILR